MAELSEATINKLLADVAALTADVQSAKQTSQQLNQAVNDLLSKQGSAATQVLQEETGMGERAQLDNADRSGLLFGNAKRTADLAQTIDIGTIKQHQDLYVSAVSQLQKELAAINQVTLQALQNSVEATDLHNKNTVETIHAANKQKAEHSDLAHDSFWNPVSAGAGMNLTAGAAPANRITDTTGAVAAGAVNFDIAAVAGVVTKAIDATITPVMAVLQQIVALLTAQSASKA